MENSYARGNGQKYEHQFCVMLESGPNKGIRNYVWASEDQIKKAVDYIGEHILEKGIKDSTGEKGFVVYPTQGFSFFANFTKGKMGSLEISVEDFGMAEPEEVANAITDRCGLPPAFVGYKSFLL
ncbi:MAG: hypothetical protein PHH54_02245 [Candidatus Nanoarchaeia archaeon]|nr:hypothetical protein [Candidatus Nanoarchaeia archaeon]MDD5740782.1 hypothetical protein [Candidatus Nanoarchaeia archaeon]